VKYGKAVSLVTNRPGKWTYLPSLVIWFFSRTDVRECVPCYGQEYGHIVALQAYILHNWCAYGPTVACGGPVPRPGMKGKWLLGNDLLVFQACEFGSFAPSWCSHKIVRNTPKPEFGVQWGRIGCVRCEKFRRNFLRHDFIPRTCAIMTRSAHFTPKFVK
jgi:hypothetical protein